MLATRIVDGHQLLFDAGALEAARPGTLASHARATLDAGRSETVQVDDADWFLDLQLPPSRLLIVGAVHVAQSLAPLAALAGYVPVVIDPRAHFATPDRFPGIALRHEWPDEAIQALDPDEATAIALLTHDPKLDDPALERALGSAAFYIGALGSGRTHASRLARLRETGHGEAALGRVRGPIGLALGSRTPEEIAISILAEIIAVRRGAALGRRQA